MLDPGDPGAGLVQALEQVDRPLMGGLGGEHPGKRLVHVAHDEGDRPAAVGVGAQGLRQADDVRRLEGETGARHLDDLGEPAHLGIGQLFCAVPRTSSPLTVPRATMVTRRWSGDISM